MIDQKRFQRVAELFGRAIVLPGSDRAEFLRTECDGDSQLEFEVSELIGHHEDPSGMLDQPMASETSFGHITKPTNFELVLPKRIGRYNIRRVLGKGGMGIVYLAEQENPRRQVAVKVVRPALVGSDACNRFEMETAVLGRLQHQCIAQIYEAGVHEDAFGLRPFFAMEYVNGSPLVEHSHRHAASVRDKLELFVRICETVHYAHQKGVIHRDLKPSNILVTQIAPSPKVSQHQKDKQRRQSNVVWLPKILDFGVARATDGDVQLTSPRTKTGQLIGTLPYMSPEQITGSGCDVDTRSDIYSLGVILYELLADELPFVLKGVSNIEAAKRITEHDPRPLSDFGRELRGDVSTIVMQALAKEPRLRYQSAHDLAADIQRYLADQPIDARPPSTTYQLKKFAQRNRGLVTGIALLFVTLIVGVVMTSVFAAGQARAVKRSNRHLSIAQKKQEKAEENFRQARRAIERLTDLSRQLETIAGTDEIREMALREVLAFYLKNIDESGDPEVVYETANSYRLIAKIRFDLNDPTNAIDDLDRAQGILKILCETDPAKLKYQTALADSYFEMGRCLQLLDLNRESAESFLTTAELYLTCWCVNANESFQFSRACALSNASNSFLNAGLLERSNELNSQATELLQSAPDQSSFAILFNLALAFEVKGKLLMKHGETIKAIPFFEETLRLSEKATTDGLNHPSNLDHIARIHDLLGRAHRHTGCRHETWTAHADRANQLYGRRWESRPDRPALGLVYATHCWYCANEYWLKGDVTKGEKLYLNANDTLQDIDERFPEFSKYYPGQDEVTYLKCLLYATCPDNNLQNRERALGLSEAMLKQRPDSEIAQIAFMIVQSLYGDLSSANEFSTREPWSSADTTMMRMIRCLIQFRIDEAPGSSTELAFVKRIRDGESDSHDFERSLAEAIIQRIESN